MHNNTDICCEEELGSKLREVSVQVLYQAVFDVW